MNAINRILALTASIGWLSTAGAVEAVLTNDDYTPHPRGVTSRSATIVVNANTTGIFSFDLRTLPDEAQTPPVVIERAILKLFINKVKNNGSITISTPGGPSVSFSNPFTGVVSRSYTAFDVTQLVQATIAAGNIELRVTTDSAHVIFDSKENTATSHPATLDIEVNPTVSPTFTVPAAKITGQLTAAQLQPGLTLAGTTTGTFTGDGSGLTVSGDKIAAGTIPIGALATRAVSGSMAGVGNVATSGVVDAPIVATGALADLAGLSVTLTTTGKRPVFVGFINGALSVTTGADEGAGKRTGGVDIGIIKNTGAAFATTQFFTQTDNNVTITSKWPAGSFWTIDPPAGAPATITYKVQGRLIGTGSSASYVSANLVAFEL